MEATLNNYYKNKNRKISILQIKRHFIVKKILLDNYLKIKKDKIVIITSI